MSLVQIIRIELSYARQKFLSVNFLGAQVPSNSKEKGSSILSFVYMKDSATNHTVAVVPMERCISDIPTLYVDAYGYAQT